MGVTPTARTTARGAAPPVQPAVGVNAGMTVSAGGRLDIQNREGVAPNYYNDIANNCTYGVGQLAHIGPCTAEELATPVSQQQIQQTMDASVRRFEQRVRDGVPGRQLNQNQFDALASFVFNVPRGEGNRVLDMANRGDDAAVAREMTGAVYYHPRDANGVRLHQPVLSRGLVNRRNGEVTQYQRQP